MEGGDVIMVSEWACFCNTLWHLSSPEWRGVIVCERSAMTVADRFVALMRRSRRERIFR
jgi:hypothetical protein